LSTDHQSEHYGQDYDYLNDSPQLKHTHLYDELTARIAGAIDVSCLPGHPTEVLETGAGDGSVTEHRLARGYAITATELSAESIESMNRRFGSKDRFSAVHNRGICALGRAPGSTRCYSHQCCTTSLILPRSG
jgi:hypothetical protein